MALFGPPPLKPTLTRLRSDGRRVREVAGGSRGVRRHRPEPAERVPRVHRVPVDGDYVIRVGLGGVRPAGSEPGRRWRSGSTSGRSRPLPHDPGTRRDVRRRPAGFRRPDDGVQGQADGRRSLDLGRGSAHFRRAAGAVTAARTRRRARSRRAKAFKPPAGRDARADRAAAQAVRRRPRRSSRRCRVERRARQHGRRRRPVLAADRPVARQPREDLHVRASRRRAHADVRARGS